MREPSDIGGEMVEKGVEGLEVWQKARQLMIAVHKRMIVLLPPEEKWDLAQQVRRSSKSVIANIAEGYGRYYYQDNVRFCYSARGSLDETVNYMVTALDLGYISRDLYHELRELADEIRRMLNGYIASLKRRRQGQDEPGSQLAIREMRASYIPEDMEADLSTP